MTVPPMVRAQSTAPLKLGLRENLGQFSLLLLINAFVGAMVGMERAVLPLLAEREFGIASRTSILSFLVTFGIVKAFTNLLAGRAADRWGRRNALIAGWLFGLPVPLMIMAAPSWGWVVAANVLLGVNQGLCWSAAIIMKVDLVGPLRRGLAIGLNEASGYLAVSLAALGSGYLAGAYALRPQPFLIGVAASVGGLICSFLTRETRNHAQAESRMFDIPGQDTSSFRSIFHRVSWQDRSLFAASQAGLVNNLNDGVSWGLFPLYFAAGGADLREVALLVAIYPAVWAVGQLASGPLSDRFGRKGMIVAGMSIQGAALFGIGLTRRFPLWTASMVLLGIGTALVYPTLLGAISDHSHASWRASAIGVYRLWRDLGYALGAILAGVAADLLDIPISIEVIAVVTLLSGFLVAGAYREFTPRAASRPTR